MNKTLPSTDYILRSMAEDSLSSFIKQAWPIIEPGTTFLPNWHIDLIAEHLEAVDLGQIKRLIINIPPRYGKSLVATVMWPVYSWIKNPEMRWMFASYSASLSKKHSVDRRTIIESDWYQNNWDIKLAKDQNEKSRFMNTKQGVMAATSVGGAATGLGGNRLIIDDPHNPVEAVSDIQRESGNDFVTQTLSTRLDDKKLGAIVVIMQRLHELDLTGRLLEQGEGAWTHLKIPCEAPAQVTVKFPLSDRVVEREQGDLICPEREGPEEIKNMRVTLGSYGYSGQYDQEPTPAGGGMLKEIWWTYWYYGDRPKPNPVFAKDEEGNLIECRMFELPTVMDQWLQSWDMTFKDLKTSDFVSGQVWGRNQANKFLMHQHLERMDIVDSIKAVQRMCKEWPQAMPILIEDKANGPAVIASLRNEISGIIACEPIGSKEARVAAGSPQVESGNICIPHPSIHPWVVSFVSQCSGFPNAAHDDQVDSAFQAINYMPRHSIRMQDVDIQGTESIVDGF